MHLGTPLGDHWSGAMVGVSDIVTITITNDEDGKSAGVHVKWIDADISDLNTF